MSSQPQPTPSNNSGVRRLARFLLLATAYRSAASAFVVSPSSTCTRATTTTTSFAPPLATRRHTPLFVGVADPPNKEDEKEKTNKNNNDDDDGNSDWVATRGGFLPNLPGLLRRASTKSPQTVPEQVVTIQEYKAVVADEADQMVVVRFYAPWCKACKAVQQPYRKLCRELSGHGIKFVECPVTKENAYLHEGLGVPSLPYGHIYHPEAGLVEERKLNKHVFQEFEQVLESYVEGECAVMYPADGSVCVPSSDGGVSM